MSEVSDAQFGLLLSIDFLLALLIDYPSSALSDTIGQKFILLVTCFMYAIAYTLITLPTNLLVLIIAFILFGIGDGFFYGTLQTWYSNNYKAYITDPGYKIYAFVDSRLLTIRSLITGCIYISTGFFVTTYSRSTLFLVQSFLLMALAVCIIYMMNDHPNIIRHRSINNFHSYIERFKLGIKKGFTDTSLRYVIMGIILYTACSTIWEQLLIFPFYFLYVKNDANLGILRSLGYFSGIIIFTFIAMIIRHLSINQLHKTYKTIVLIGQPIFYFLFVVYSIIVPVPQITNIQIIGELLLVIIAGLFFGSFENILRGRFLLIIIPDENRNSILSINTTIAALLTVPGLTIIGFLLETYNIASIILLLSFITFIGSLIILIGIYKYEKKELSLKMQS